MFGKKKKQYISEENRNALSLLLEKREVYDANMSQLEAAENRVAEDVAQLEENSIAIVENAMLNVQTEAELLHNLDAFAEEQKHGFSNYTALCEGVSNQLEASLVLVDHNKHFTKPAKYLSEIPALLREKNKQYEILLAELEEYRMDEAAYAKAVASLQEEIRKSYLELQELEQNIHHMVSLLKESNKGAANLYRLCQSSAQITEKSVMRDTSDDMAQMRDKVVSLRNLDEEIVKCGERNKLQVSDVKEEYQAMKKDLAEIDSDISYFFDVAEEQV